MGPLAVVVEVGGGRAFRKRFYFSFPALRAVREELSSALPPPTPAVPSAPGGPPVPPPPLRPIRFCFSRDSEMFESCWVPLSVPGRKDVLGFALPRWGPLVPTLSSLPVLSPGRAG